ncbi:aldolase [Paenibacillus sp.]|uniref:aldolase n=1 Tax=Paenibacillus sp. TaxID=58172 RepID=UPI002811B137|nr:aldolase [Paenibacillus sp.]
MDGSATTAIYEAFGFRVSSEFLMPELTMHEDRSYADIRIRQSDLSPLWREVDHSGKLVYAVEDRILFRVPDTAIFSIASGNTILVSPSDGMEEDKMRLYLLGTCMAIVLLQRKILPLHGSAIKLGDMAYAIVGESGAGKSTLASMLMRYGYPLVSDDLIAVSFETESGGARRGPEIIPSFPQQKLWSESLRRLEMKIGDYRPLFERENKYAVPIKDRFYGKRLPFGGVFELVKTEEGNVDVAALRGLEAVRALYRHTFRNFFVPMLGLQQWHLDVSVQLLQCIQVRQLRRPSNGDTIVQLAESIISIANRGNQDAARQSSSFS